jgi:Domain of unknown function (DUF2382)
MRELTSRAADTAEDAVVVRSEERLRAGTVNVVAGRARLITSVVVEEQTFTVPVRRQEIRLAHESVPASEQVATDVAPAEETYEVVAYAEQVLWVPRTLSRPLPAPSPLAASPSPPTCRPA